MNPNSLLAQQLDCYVFLCSPARVYHLLRHVITPWQVVVTQWKRVNL